MRIQHYFIALASCTLLASGCGKTERAAFYVEGNCEQCKSIIEKTLNDQRGVDSAGWDFATSMATVKYNANRTDSDLLQEALSNLGFETQFYPADAGARAKLPDCCRKAVSRKLGQ